jgi:fibronectin type 3 domain-containing protein
MSGVTFPVTLSPGQAATLNVEFDPTTAVAATGQLTITSNSSTGATTVIGLSGTGEAQEVDLTWNAPSGSSVLIAGYHVYRSTTGSTSYQLLNSSEDTQTAYTDTTVQGGQTYAYIVKSVDPQGVESAPSNTIDVSVP